MKKWFGLLVAIVAVQTVTSIAPVAEASLKEGTGEQYLASARFQDGMKISLQADTGAWLSRCRDCQKAVDGVDLPDTVTLRATPDVGHAQFEVVDTGGGKIALKSDLGKYVSRCRGCIVDGVVSDFLTIHGTNPDRGPAQFTLEQLSNGKYALKADTGKYVARCNGCSPTSVTSDTVTVHVDNPNNKPHAQWTIVEIL